MRWSGPPDDGPARPQAIYEFVGFDDPEIAAQVRDLIERHGQSLYVGRTNNLGKRTDQHAGSRDKQVWFRQTHVIVVDHLPPGSTVRHADVAEQRQIDRRRPWYNKRGNRHYRLDKHLAAERRFSNEFGHPQRQFLLFEWIAAKVDHFVRVLAPAVAGALFATLVWVVQAKVPL